MVPSSRIQSFSLSGTTGNVNSPLKWGAKVNLGIPHSLEPKILKYEVLAKSFRRARDGTEFIDPRYWTNRSPSDQMEVVQ